MIGSTTSAGLGFLLAVLSAVGNGTFAALSKLCPDVHPVHFNALLSVGTLISSLVFAVVYPTINDAEINIRLDFVACLSGTLFILANTFAFFAIPRIGIALAQGTWGGVSLAVSFVWGTYGPKEVLKVPRSLEGAYGGILLILIGIIGLAQSKTLAGLLFSSKERGSAPLLRNDSADRPSDYISLDFVESGSRVNSVNDREMSESKAQKYKFVGILCACLTGVLGGSILVPNQIGSLQGQEAVASFGTGAFCTALILTPLYFALLDNSEESPHFPRRCSDLWPGIVAGIIWNIGNIMQIFAIPAIGYAVAGPINQCGLLISGLLGIFLFKEIKGRSRITVFFFCSSILIVGAFVLSASV